MKGFIRGVLIGVVLGIVGIVSSAHDWKFWFALIALNLICLIR